MKKLDRFLFIIIILIIAIVMLSSTTKAIDTNIYNDIYTDPGASQIDDFGSKVLGIVQVVAAVVSIIMITSVGVKYMMAAPNEKADLKGHLIMVVVGAVLIFGGAKILVWIISSFNSSLIGF